MLRETNWPLFRGAAAQFLQEGWDDERLRGGEPTSPESDVPLDNKVSSPVGPDASEGSGS